MTNPEDDPGHVPQSWVYLASLAAIVVSFTADVWWGDGLATAAGVATCSMLVVALASRPDWQHDWFWVTYSVLAAFHVLAVILIPWSDARTPGFYVIPFGFADGFACLAVIWLVEKMVGKKSN